MKHSFTPSLLIRFIYDEVSTSERLAVMEALRTNAQLRKTYNELKAAHNNLPQAKFNAPTSALDNILKYSESTAVERC
jgi:hypothetical protein